MSIRSFRTTGYSSPTFRRLLFFCFRTHSQSLTPPSSLFLSQSPGRNLVSSHKRYLFTPITLVVVPVYTRERKTSQVGDVS